MKSKQSKSSRPSAREEPDHYMYNQVVTLDAPDEEDCPREGWSDTESSGSEHSMNNNEKSQLTSPDSRVTESDGVGRRRRSDPLSFFGGRVMRETWECPAPFAILMAFTIVVQSTILLKSRAGLFPPTNHKSPFPDEHFVYSSTQNITSQQSPSDHQPYKSFNSTNPHEMSWCPNAKCKNSPLCSPCNRRYLFIVATGRSGSTTLLSMLNYLPNVRLSGENNDELYIASRLESNLELGERHSILEQHYDQPKGPWVHNGVPEQAMACPIQDILYTMNPPPSKVQHHVHLPDEPTLEEYDRDRILGLKTIRIHNKHTWGPNKAAQFFKENFPCSRVVVNLRMDVKSQIQSMVNLGWKADADVQEKDNGFLKDFAEYLGEDMAKVIDMDEWTMDVSVLNSLIEWLGYSDCHFKEILHENHDGYGMDSTRIDLGDQCRYAF